MRLALAASVLAITALVAGCGGGSEETTATDPAAASSTSAAGSPSTAATAAATVGVRATCADLYRPPGQWMQHAITFVHAGSDGAGSSADEIVAGLAAAEQQALAPLAVDIDVVRAGVEAYAAGGDIDKGAFDQAANRLAGHCELHSD